MSAAVRQHGQAAIKPAARPPAYHSHTHCQAAFAE